MSSSLSPLSALTFRSKGQITDEMLFGKKGKLPPPQ